MASATEVGDGCHWGKLCYLHGSDLFRDFTPAQLERFHDSIHMRTCRANHVFYRPGETGEVMFMLKRGSAQLYRTSPDGRKFVRAHVSEGSIFGEMACIGQGMYDCYAEALEDSLICTVSRADVTRLIHEYPQFALRLLEAVGDRALKAERRLEDMVFKGLIPRLAAFLLGEENDGVVEGFTHQDISEHLGVYRETTTHALNELKTAGIVAISRRKIRIVDPQRLARASRVG